MGKVTRYNRERWQSGRKNEENEGKLGEGKGGRWRWRSTQSWRDRRQAE